MKTKLDPAYGSIEEHIRHAQLERSLYLAEMIASGIVAVSRGISAAATWLAKRADNGRALAAPRATRCAPRG